ncbi:MAG: branched-chain amino acid ABC transporter permease [Anaerolineaceae bacterium]|jgi:branched-chain amino acid transport system permease protein|nr:branched-chain amino acid ABC transporter permease [Anaerolineaceae bacterium]MDD4043142.1 branched-chain amino acid ABC transporter permease [Anaerolineaceae bacterium]MDD4577878.1 branched-chain amino acid ABC transporter permease [Anaerolineaceae bacterium]
MKNIWKKDKGFVIFLLAAIAFPFVFSLLGQTSLTEGTNKFWQGQLINFFIMAIFAMSYDLLIGYAGMLSFGHAASFGGGAYTVALLLTYVAPDIVKNYQIFIGSLNITEIVVLLVCFLAAILVSILIGLLFSASAMRVKGPYFAMLTLALATALNLLTRATDFVEWTGADEGMHGVPVPYWINPTQNRLTFYFIALVFLVVTYILMKRIVSSPTGRVIQATRENEDRSRMIGYNPVTYRTLAFVMASVFAGIAGALYSLWTVSATPSMTSGVTTVNALIMTILGGMGTLIGPVLGAGIMQIFSQFFYTWFGARWPLVFGIIFVLIVMFLPYGIVGTWRMHGFKLKEGWQRFWDLLKTKPTAEK